VHSILRVQGGGGSRNTSSVCGCTWAVTCLNICGNILWLNVFSAGLDWGLGWELLLGTCPQGLFEGMSSSTMNCFLAGCKV
jgi:hypothetical protein